MDKEQYELAAKVAGIPEKSIKNAYADGNFWLKDKRGDGIERIWNPLESDADAFRLMVDAGIVAKCYRQVAIAAEAHRDFTASKFRQKFSDFEGDKAAATRKAIFDCAVAIGKSL